MNRNYGYFYSPAYIAHYERVYPYRKCLMIFGGCGIAAGLIMFISLPILFSSLPFNPGFAVLGFAAIILLFFSAVSCQCGYASVRWHDIKDQMGTGAVAYAPGGVIMTQPYGYPAPMAPVAVDAFGRPIATQPYGVSGYPGVYPPTSTGYNVQPPTSGFGQPPAYN